MASPTGTKDHLDSDLETTRGSGAQEGGACPDSEASRQGPHYYSDIGAGAAGREASEAGRLLQSAPSQLHQDLRAGERPSKEELHATGECTPCYFFVYKGDGCRNGDDCQFCHSCTKVELQKRKKEKHRKLRSAMAAAAPPSDDVDALPRIGLNAPPGLVFGSEASSSVSAPAAADVPMPLGAVALATAATARPAASGVYDAFGVRVSAASPKKIAVDALEAFSVPSTWDRQDEADASLQAASLRPAFGYTMSL